MFAFSDIHHPVSLYKTCLGTYALWFLNTLSLSEQDKLCNSYNNMDYYTVSVKTREILMVEIFSSAALYRTLCGAHEFCE